MPTSHDLVVIPVDTFLESVEVEVIGRAYLLEQTANERLLRGRHGDLSAPSHEIRIAAKAGDASRHEALVLLRVHTPLEVGEAKGVALWLIVAVEWAMAVECGEVGIDHDIFPGIAIAVDPCPGTQTVVALGTVAGQTGLVVIGYRCFFVVHSAIDLTLQNYKELLRKQNLLSLFLR